MENKTKTRLEKQNNFKTVPIEILSDNPNNPNRMSKSSFAKLVRNIERTRLYEPIIVRKINTQNSVHRTRYEIINGHYRTKALKQLGYINVDICIWDVDDRQSDILLATLNRLSGTDILEKKLALLNRLSNESEIKQLSELLPLTSGQIERYRDLKLPHKPAKQEKDSFAEPLIFFVDEKQKRVIEQAIQKIKNTSSKTPARRTKSEAITKIAESFNKNYNASPEKTQ